MENTKTLIKLGENVGCTMEGIFGGKDDVDFGEKKEKAWELCKKSIDENLPLLGFELAGPEFFVVNGYTDNGYLFSGGTPVYLAGKPKDWKELGDQIGVLEMYSIKPGQPADDIKTLKDSIGFVLDQSGKEQASVKGFDNWINALENGTAAGVGTAYNAMCWTECRNFGVQFLKEAKERLGNGAGNLFDEAAGYYGKSLENLQKVCVIFPIHLNQSFDPIKDVESSKKAVEHLKKSKEAEEAGLKTLKKIYNEL